MAGVSAPLQLFGDFGFSGGHDVSPNPLQNDQICINLYAEVNKQNPKEILGLLGTPGLVQLVAAPGGGVPAAVNTGPGSGTLVPLTSPVKVFETSITTPTYATSGTQTNNGALWPIITDISSSGGIKIIDRSNYGTSFAQVAGDGNAYTYSITNGAYVSTASETAVQQAWGARSQNGHAPTGSGFTLSSSGYGAVGLASGNSLVWLPGPASGFSSNASGYCLVMSGYSTGTATFVYDVLPALNGVLNIPSSFYLRSLWPCIDGKHIIVVTASAANTGPYVWSVIALGGGSATIVSSGAMPVIYAPTLGTLTGDFSDSTPNSAELKGCLDIDLQTLYMQGNAGNNYNGFNMLSLTNGNTATLLLSIASAFTNPSIFGPGAIHASNGYLAVVRSNELALWQWAIFVPSPPTQWPMPSTVTNLPVRGVWELPNDSTALAVIGNTCYLVKIATPATSLGFATMSLTSVGTLLTTIGPVHIRDNNIGGFAVIVDGPYGYLYNIATQAFAQITDPAFLGADTVAFIDGWWVFNRPGTQTFYTNFPQYGTAFNASYFALKDGAPDNLVAVFENKEQLWLLGDKTTEIWYDAGGQYFAFQRLVGTMLQSGCKAKHSVARFSADGQDGLMWFGRSERGENVILRSRGFSVDAVSTPAFSNEVAQYPVTADAIAYTYQEDTHEFYILTFPTADTTWCYDSQSGLLHKRLSYDPYLHQFHRHRSNCFMNFQGMRIVGDYQCGSLYQLTRNAFTDAGWPILAKRRSPHVWDKGQRGRVFMASLQIDFRQGVGNANGLGVNPQAGLAISRDGGKTFGQRWNSPIGQIGQYKNRTMWRKLAFGRDNVVDIEVIDPVPRDIIGVTLKAFSSA